MRLGPLSACAAAVVLAASLVVPAAADTATPPTLYVFGAGSPGCSDAWPGTWSQPLCDVQTAADIVVPGQTVIVGIKGSPGDGGAVHLTRSGTPDKPIVFKTADPPPEAYGQQRIVIGAPWSAPGLAIDGVHDVTIDGFGIKGRPTALEISNSSDITINRADVEDLPPDNSTGIGIDISHSTNVTISRSMFNVDGPAVSIGPGVSDTDVAENVGYGQPTVSVNGATNTDITNNNVLGECGDPAFSVSGGATGTSIENNIATTFCNTTQPLITVAADSTANTRSDYNLIYSQATDSDLYSWGGTTYGSATQLATATGQGVHDLYAGTLNYAGEFVPVEGSPAVDSGDANAPGILPTDYDDNPRVDDPSTPNTGTGIGYVDRGAIELPDPITVAMKVNTYLAPVGGTVVVNLSVPTPGWAPVTRYTVDFGDGTPPTTSTSPTITHAYSTVRDAPYDIVASVTDSLGNIGSTDRQAPHQVVVVPPAPLVPIMDVYQDRSNPLHYSPYIGASTDSWQLASATCDFGDGTGAHPANDFGCDHVYQTPGTYRITMTITDAGGNTASTSQLVIARPVPPTYPTPGSGKRCPGCY
jgi:hypothetical protein